MRSGNYKLCSGRSGKTGIGKILPDAASSEITSGLFRKTSSKEFQFPSVIGPLVVSPFYQNSRAPLSPSETYCGESKELKVEVLRKVPGGHRKKELIFRHRSCENISSFSVNNSLHHHHYHHQSNYIQNHCCGTSNHEHSFPANDPKKIEPYLEDTKPSFVNGIGPDDDSPRHKDLVSQIGKLGSTQRKLRLLSSSYSHSALNTISSNNVIISDSTSYLSASSGYSSSNSSSYGSFKSCDSPISASITRNRQRSCGSCSPITDHIDNPLYDILPINQLSSQDDFQYPSIHSQFPSLQTTVIQEQTSESAFENPQNDDYILFLQNRMEIAEILRKKWSLFPINSNSVFGKRERGDLKLISKDDAVVDSKFNVGMSYGVESNYHLSQGACEDLSEESYSEKPSSIDIKMEQLRQEIALLIDQDAKLFKQLLHLHNVISSIRSHQGLDHTLPIYANVSRPETPLEQGVPRTPFEDEQEEEEEAIINEEIEQGTIENNEELEGKMSQKMQVKPETRSRPTEKKLSTSTGRKEGLSRVRQLLTKSTEVLSSQEVHVECDEDKGHFIDFFSLSHSASSASTLSSQSTSKNSYTRRLFNELKNDLGASFTRCRKSYAPNARNRKRASSIHNHHSSPERYGCQHPSGLLSTDLSCGEGSALVVIHTDDEASLLKAVNDSGSLMRLSYNPIDALSYTKTREGSKKQKEALTEDGFLSNQEATSSTTIGETLPVLQETFGSCPQLATSWQLDTKKTLQPSINNNTATSETTLGDTSISQYSISNSSSREQLLDNNPTNTIASAASTSSKAFIQGSCSSQTVSSLPMTSSTRSGYREALIM